MVAVCQILFSNEDLFTFQGLVGGQGESLDPQDWWQPAESQDKQPHVQ